MTTNHSSADSESGGTLDRIAPAGLLLVCAACVAIVVRNEFLAAPPAPGAAARPAEPPSEVLLALAAAILVLPRLRKFKFGSVEFEQEVKDRLGGLERLVPGLSPPESVRTPRPQAPTTKGFGTASLVSHAVEADSSASGLPPLAAERDRYLREHGPDGWDTDPNQGRFGGSQRAAGRELRARVVPLAGPRSSLCEVHLEVRAVGDAAPLAGKVRLYLHPTFGKYAVYDLDVVDGVAKDTIRSAGAFTVGAVADGGATRLEYDLSAAPGATQAFRTS